MSILDLTLNELKERVSELGLKPFIASQVFDWIYKKHVTSFDEMRNISKDSREVLKREFTILPYAKTETVEGPKKLAEKVIFTLEDGKYIEAVILQEKGYKTLCVSSQSGCPVDCKFCLTGVAGFNRNLSVGEIVGQILHAYSIDEPVTHLVFMGMGEPLLNYENVLKAIDIMTSKESFDLSQRKITVSTSGYLASIKRLIADERALNLAFSVGNPNPEKRRKIMPCEKRNPILEVARLIKQYLKQHNRKLTLEYTLLKGKNDGDDEAKELANLAKYLDAKVNLINLNPHDKIPFEPVTENALAEFKQKIKAEGVSVTVRFKKGQEISAACGQLGESILNAKGSDPKA